MFKTGRKDRRIDGFNPLGFKANLKGTLICKGLGIKV
jgi:hypothetical protein